jgi:lipoprotein-releasing system ATP-binding protein
MSEALRVAGLIRRYKTAAGVLDVLKGCDLVVQAGELVGLVGPSGSGKSSLLHAAGLLEAADGGEVFIAGQATAGLPDARRTALRRSAIGFVYQFHYLLPEFTARDNVALPQLIAGKTQADARAEAERLLSALGLADRLSHQPAQLSGGEQQRVAIARAFANRPRLILADEPTGNLDPDTSAAVFEALKRRVREEGAGALIATHNLALAAQMDRVVTIRNGLVAPFEA